MLTANDIAKYFLALSNNEESGELISNLKLQKLLHYAQGFYLALYDQPLFHEPIEAWAHGAVIPDFGLIENLKYTIMVKRLKFYL